ncbi:sulfite exporter TauE/SafE family protein [Legionella oakridgensis]|uniref:sulfite exporter TauE/SafE family protein n=1 Tax=Legionella oakridgensis TaxID=29423 RepID=UPI0003DDF972|nr:sulfite exporter TauE/SafE family protein [Legionella oakridgensis]ETO94530.1 putative permease [Legionella oakridgensis RV-2-2007]
MDLMYPVAGAFTGFIVGLTGVGGGALMTPILLLLFGVAPTAAVATDLWFATITKIAALLIHHREQQVDWQIVRKLWLGSLPAAFVVILALLTGLLTTIHSKFLTTLIGSVILLTAFGLLTKNWLKNHLTRFQSSRAQSFNRKQSLLTIISGIILGVLVSLTSIGAGALGSVALLYLYPARMTPNRLVGTDIAHAIPLALVAGLGYLIGGHVDGSLLFSLLLGSVPAAVLGSIAATRFKHSKLRLCIVAILSVSGLKLMF